LAPILKVIANNKLIANKLIANKKAARGRPFLFQ